MLVPGEHDGRRLGAPSGKAREPVGAVAHEREQVGDRGWAHAELLPHASLVEQPPAAAVELHDPRLGHALREVLVGRADQHLLDSAVGSGMLGRGGQGVVGLLLDHRPDANAKRLDRLLEQRELRQEIRVDPGTRLVEGPQLVAERLDHVVRSHPEVGGAVLEDREGGPQYPPDRAHLVAARVAMRRHGEEVTEQLVRPVE
jgi:hypothetical protein